MSEVPKGWAEATGKDLMRFVRGVAYKKEQASLEPQDGYSGVLRAGNIQGGEIREEDMVYAPNEVISQEQRLQQGDVVVAMSSGSASIVGKAAQVQLPRPDLAFGAFCGVFRPGAPEMAPWLGSFFQTQTYRNVVSSVSAGVNINNLRADHILDLPIPVPPLPEQRRIVAKIEALMARSRAAREALADIPTLLDRYRQSVLAAAFRGDLTLGWRMKQTKQIPSGIKLLAKIERDRQDSRKSGEPLRPGIPADKLPVLPDGWAWSATEELTVPGRPILYGIIKPGPDTPGGVPYVRVTEMATGTIDVASLRRCHKDRASLFQRATLNAGDVLVSKDGTIGRVAIVPPELEGGNITQHVLRFSPHALMYGPFIARVLEAPPVQRWMKDATQGVALQGINVGDFRLLPLPVPPVEEQREIVNRLDVILEGIQRIEQIFTDTRERCHSLDQSILAKAFRGELVPQYLSDEPAEVLLARIRGSREDQGAPARRRGRPAAAPAPVPAPQSAPAPAALNHAAEEVIPYAADAPTRVDLEALDTDALMAAFRQTLATQGSWDTDEDLLRALAQRFGYQRLGSRAKETLKGHLRAALLRRIAVREPDGTLSLGPRTLDAYTRDELIACIPSVLRKGQALAREDLMRALLHHLGFQRLTDAAQEALKSALNVAIRRGVLQAGGGDQIRRIP